MIEPDILAISDGQLEALMNHPKLFAQQYPNAFLAFCEWHKDQVREEILAVLFRKEG